jgi:hypothetical protein
MRRLVFVNSARSAFTELNIDRHVVLLGNNNHGKTSILNALKLFLLPEVNMKRCEKKFGFQAADGRFFGDMESYRYYFPADNSFILLEAENRYGAFCIVLHRAREEMGFSRVAVPKPYDDIRHHFWDFGSDSNEGMGRPRDGFTLGLLLSELKEYGSIPVGDRKAIRERFFSEDQLDPERGRFCLLPLRKGGEQSELDTFRQLMMLAFDLRGARAGTLPGVMATIIEGRKKRTEDRLSVPLDDILEEYRSLKSRRDQLQNIENHQPDWEAFERLFSQFGREGVKAAQQYLNLTHTLERQKNSVDGEVEAAKQTFDAARGQALDADEQLKRKNRSLIEQEGGHKQTSKNLAILRKRIARIADVRNEYPASHSVRDVIIALTDYREQLENDMKLADDHAARMHKMEELNKSAAAKKSRCELIRKALSDTTPGLLDGLDTHSADVLNSLNTGFSRLRNPIGPEDRTMLDQFAGQFTIEPDGLLKYLGEAFGDLCVKPYNAASKKTELEQQLLDTEAEYRADLKELARLKSLNGGGTQAQSQQKREAMDKDHRQASEDIKLMGAFEQLQEDVEQTQKEVDTLKSSLAELQAEVAQLKTLSDEANKKRDEAQNALTHQIKRKERLADYAKQMAMLKNNYAAIIDALTGRLKASPVSLDDAALDALEQQCLSVKYLRDQLQECLSSLLKAGILDDGDMLAYKTSYSFTEVREYRERIAAVYETLTNQLQILKDQIAAHNDQTAIKVDEMRAAQSLIDDFRQSVNQAFDKYQISNLDSVRIHLTLHPQFERLMVQLDKVDLYSDGLHDPRLYSLLNDFCNEFFNSQGEAATLQMDRVIEKVSYSCRLVGEDTYTEKGQSTGTVSIINCVLLVILLRNLLRSDAALMMPIVLDEISQIDGENLPTILNVANQHGFAVFGATPSHVPQVAEHISYFASLGLFEATQYLYADCRTLFHSYIERLVDEVPIPAESVVTETREGIQVDQFTATGGMTA